MSNLVKEDEVSSTYKDLKTKLYIKLMKKKKEEGGNKSKK